LEETIEQWNRFKSDQFSYFYESGPDRVDIAGSSSTSSTPRQKASKWGFSRKEIENIFEDLHHVLVDLKKLKNQYENFKQQVGRPARLIFPPVLVLY